MAYSYLYIVVINNLGSFYHTTPMRLRIGILHSDINPTRLSLTFAACMMIYKTKKEFTQCIDNGKNKDVN